MAINGGAISDVLNKKIPTRSRDFFYKTVFYLALIASLIRDAFPFNSLM